MQALLNNDELFKQWLGNTLSQPKHEMDLAPLEAPLTCEQMSELIACNNDEFERLGGTRAIFQQCEDTLLLSINGENYLLPLSDLKAVRLLTDNSYFNTEDLDQAQPSLVFIQTFTTLVNEGVWFN